MHNDAWWHRPDPRTSKHVVGSFYTLYKPYCAVNDCRWGVCMEIKALFTLSGYFSSFELREVHDDRQKSSRSSFCWLHEGRVSDCSRQKQRKTFLNKTLDWHSIFSFYPRMPLSRSASLGCSKGKQLHQWSVETPGVESCLESNMADVNTACYFGSFAARLSKLSVKGQYGIWLFISLVMTQLYEQQMIHGWRDRRFRPKMAPNTVDVCRKADWTVFRPAVCRRFLVMDQVYYPEQEKFTEQVGAPTVCRSVSAGPPHSLHQLGDQPRRAATRVWVDWREEMTVTLVKSMMLRRKRRRTGTQREAEAQLEKQNRHIL